MMDLNWLDDVLVLLEEGNMSRAAARRNITQPAFSRRIRGFEDWLGVEVLERHANRVEIRSALVSNESEIRALITRLAELRTKMATHDPAASLIPIAAQHAAVHSTFPDMALRAKRAYPGLRFRLHARNLNDCITLFLRGDTGMMLCYQTPDSDPMPLREGVLRGVWGHDYLIPVVGGNLRYSVRDNRSIATRTPAVVYPDASYFGQVLARARRSFGTAGFSANPVCETAFSGGMREMVLKGLGVGWLPFSMVYKQIESGELISLAMQYGQEELDVAIYAHRHGQMARQLIDLWTAAPGRTAASSDRAPG